MKGRKEREWLTEKEATKRMERGKKEMKRKEMKI